MLMSVTMFVVADEVSTFLWTNCEKRRRNALRWECVAELSNKRCQSSIDAARAAMRLRRESR